MIIFRLNQVKELQNFNTGISLLLQPNTILTHVQSNTRKATVSSMARYTAAEVMWKKILRG